MISYYMSELINEFTHIIKVGCNISGIRARKKERTRQKILDIARTLFDEKGYKKVKTAEVAQLAEIGEGTLFNYFKSKGELFIAAYFDHAQTPIYPLSLTGIHTENDLFDEIINIVDFYLADLKEIKKGLLRELYAVAYDDANAEAIHAKLSLLCADQLIIENLQRLFAKMILERKLLPTFDVDLAVSGIYRLMVAILNEFIYYDEMSYEKMCEELRKSYVFMLSAHLS